MKHLIRNFLLVLMLLYGSACGIKNIDFLKMSDCALPCWNQIYVGKTTKDEVIDTISKLSFIDPTINLTDSIGNSFISEKTVFYTRDTGRFFNSDVTAYYSKNIVEKIYFEGHIDHNINQIIQMIGDPDYVYTGRENVSGEVLVFMVYPTKGFDYGVDISSPNEEITGNNIPAYFEIFNPNAYDELVKNHWFPYQDTTQLYKWKGFGSIQKMYWPSQQP